MLWCGEGLCVCVDVFGLETTDDELDDLLGELESSKQLLGVGDGTFT